MFIQYSQYKFKQAIILLYEPTVKWDMIWVRLISGLSLTMTIHIDTNPEQIAKVKDAIRVTADGPRSQRKKMSKLTRNIQNHQLTN